MLISTRESAPSCHDEEACSRVRHGYTAFLFSYQLIVLNFLEKCTKFPYDDYLSLELIPVTNQCS